MKELNKKELSIIVGGINITYSLINSLIRAIESAMEIGRSFGTAIRRIGGKGICGIN